jgi:hypothetical protein
MATQYVSGLKKSRAAAYFFYQKISSNYTKIMGATTFLPAKTQSRITQP